MFLFNINTDESLMKQDHLRMNVAPDQTIIIGLHIFLGHRSLSQDTAPVPFLLSVFISVEH